MRVAKRAATVSFAALAAAACLAQAASASPWWNDRPLGLGNGSSSVPLTTPFLEGGDAAWRPPPPLAFRDGTIVSLSGDGRGSNSEPASLQGFNWAGFNYIQYGMEFFEGLGEGSETSTGDFATVVYRQQLLGFNLVRIPFRFASLFEDDDDAKSGTTVADSEEGALRLLATRRLRRPTRTLARRCHLTSRAALKKVLSNPTPPFYSQIDYGSIRLPKPNAVPARPSSYSKRNDTKRGRVKNPPSCNWYLPDTSILDRLLWAAQYYVANGFYVILDWHPVDEPEVAAQQDSALVSDGAKLASDWQALSAALASLPAWRDGRLKGRVLLEPINEPDRLGMAWNVETTGRLNVTAARVDAEKRRARRKRRSEDETVAAASAVGGRKLLQESLDAPAPFTTFDARDGSVVSTSGPELSLASTEAPYRVAPTKVSKQQSTSAVPVSRADLDRGTFNSTQRPLAGLLLQTTKSIYSVLGESSLFILEGTNQSYWTPPLSWGGAFITDGDVAEEHRRRNRKYSDASPFFDALSSEPEIASRVALGPHVYGPSIGWSAEQTRGETLWKTLSLAFGQRSRFGQRFPVFVTEFGTRLDGRDEGKIRDDLTWLTDFARWANAWPETGNTKRVRAWCWWQWSPSAWDTGGLTEDDWLTPRWDKVGNLTTARQTYDETGGGWGLLPWYLGGGRARASAVGERVAPSPWPAPGARAVEGDVATPSPSPAPGAGPQPA